jgi:hypothetical protein
MFCQTLLFPYLLQLFLHVRVEAVKKPGSAPVVIIQVLGDQAQSRKIDTDGAEQSVSKMLKAYSCTSLDGPSCGMVGAISPASAKTTGTYSGFHHYYYL